MVPVFALMAGVPLGELLTNNTLQGFGIILASVVLVTEVQPRIPHPSLPTATPDLGAAGDGQRGSDRTLRRFAHAV